jgi:hypothetical protein
MDDGTAPALRQMLLDALLRQGFTLSEGKLAPPNLASKDNIRQLHAHLRAERLHAARNWLTSVEDSALAYFANGSEVDVVRMRPRLEPVDTRFKSDLFRYASLLWSVPVSAGYGRRMRFLVFDDSNGKLIGLFALGDPVYNLGVRDRWIGWSVAERSDRLYHVMDAYVLGAVPPYSCLLGGKLVALLATSDEVRDAFRARYSGKASQIRKVRHDPHLVLLTTTSALGRSSLYNRLRVDEGPAFIRLGYTEGWGHFHFSEGVFARVKAY